MPKRIFLLSGNSITYQELCNHDGNYIYAMSEANKTLQFYDWVAGYLKEIISYSRHQPSIGLDHCKFIPTQRVGSRCLYSFHFLVSVSDLGGIRCNIQHGFSYETSPEPVERKLTDKSSLMKCPPLIGI